MLLPLTQSAFAERIANSPQDFGAHNGVMTRMGGAGVRMGDVPFEFGIHEVSDIDPFALTGKLSGWPVVPEVLPQRPLEVNLMLHADPAERGDPEWITESKIFLATLLRTELEIALPDNEDSVYSYVIGDPDSALITADSRYIAGTASPLAAAEKVSELSRQGLTVVMSTFKHLPVGQLELPVQRGNTLAVKLNHLFEIELQPGAGVWYTGDSNMPKVDADKPKQLRRWNEILATRSLAITDALHKQGTPLAQVTFDRRHPKPGFEVRVVDRAIARALGQLSHR